ncbi:multiheme c-type cytochrome [Desulforapulum autotrophicum]|nr:multiheme c-type cytochrome [Desulforapulum autotrophicum]
MKKAEVIFKSFSMMGMDVIAPGLSDFRFGVPYLNGLIKQNKLNAVCANLVYSETELPCFSKYSLITRGDKRILVTSVLSPGARYLVNMNYKVLDPVKALAAVRDQVPHDLMIVVLQTDLDQAQEWIKMTPGIDLAIVGAKHAVCYEKIKVNNASLVYNNDKGQVISHVDLSINGGKIDIPVPKGVPVMESMIQADGEIVKLIEAYKTWFKDYTDKRNKETNNDSHVIVPEFYVGSQWCVRCHGEIVDSWKKTSHANAIESLVKKGEAENPECLACHATGVEEAKKQGLGELSSILAASKMLNVQCEACHGPAGIHVRNPKLTSHFKKVDKNTCIRCHNDKYDPGFDFEKKSKIVMHVGGGQK